MYKRGVTATRGVRLHGSAYLHLAVALRNLEDVPRCGFRHKLRLVVLERRTDIVHHLQWICLNQFVEHTFHFHRSILRVTDYKAVPSRLVDKLYPRHINLRHRRAAPLASLQHYHTDRRTGKAHLLEHRHKHTLRKIQRKRNVIATLLVLDPCEHERPKAEVVLAPYAYKRFRQGFLSYFRSARRSEELRQRTAPKHRFHERLLKHRFRHVLPRYVKVGNLNPFTFQYSTFSGQRIERSEKDGIPIVILLQQSFNFFFHLIGLISSPYNRPAM